MQKEVDLGIEIGWVYAALRRKTKIGMPSRAIPLTRAIGIAIVTHSGWIDVRPAFLHQISDKTGRDMIRQSSRNKALKRMRWPIRDLSVIAECGRRSRLLRRLPRNLTGTGCLLRCASVCQCLKDGHFAGSFSLFVAAISSPGKTIQQTDCERHQAASMIDISRGAACFGALPIFPTFSAKASTCAASSLVAPMFTPIASMMLIVFPSPKPVAFWKSSA